MASIDTFAPYSITPLKSELICLKKVGGLEMNHFNLSLPPYTPLAAPEVINEINFD